MEFVIRILKMIVSKIALEFQVEMLNMMNVGFVREKEFQKVTVIVMAILMIVMEYVEELRKIWDVVAVS